MKTTKQRKAESGGRRARKAEAHWKLWPSALGPPLSAMWLLTASLLPGCQSAKETDREPEAEQAAPASAEHHAHPEKGPHGGDLVELGMGEYHAELVRDEQTNAVVVFLLDATARQTVPTRAPYLLLNAIHNGAPVQFKLTPTPSEDDIESKSPRFLIRDDKIANILDGNAAEVRLVVTIADHSYTGVLGGGDHKPHRHSHEGADALVWRRDRLEHKGYSIRLGHHGVHLHAGEPVEPAVGITREGKPVDNARVYNALIAEDGKTILADEVRTVYEPPSAEEPAHYAQGELMIPQGVARMRIRFRIVLPNGDGEATYDVPVRTES